MKLSEEVGFLETTGTVARAAGCLPETVRAYADAGLIECRRLADGSRLFRKDAAERVRELLAERMARRGRRAAHSAA